MKQNKQKIEISLTFVFGTAATIIAFVVIPAIFLTSYQNEADKVPNETSIATETTQEETTSNDRRGRVAGVNIFVIEEREDSILGRVWSSFNKYLPFIGFTILSFLIAYYFVKDHQNYKKHIRNLEGFKND